MLKRLQHRAHGQEGFTLIELLVVILIIGILAAVAIPTFLSQTTKARDSSIQSALGTVQTTESTYATSNGGNYTGTWSSLTALEPSLSSAPTPSFTPTGVTNYTYPTTTGYSLSMTSTSGSNPVTYALAYSTSTGAVTKYCAPANTSGCSANNTWGS